MNTDQHGFFNNSRNYRVGKNISVLSVFICVNLWLILLASCSTKPTDPRTVIPADALVYLETNDLGAAMGAITDSEAFAKISSKKPDLSSLKGVKTAIAVTGFETNELEVTEENSVLNFRPHFVAAIETNAWGWQAERFADNQLGEFVNESYGGEVELVVTAKNDGKSFVWTAPDGRKAYALLQGSLLFFSNDESAIEKCLAVKRGEADSIAKSGRTAGEGKMASGFISPDGVAQIANIAGISLAMKASEEGEVKSFVARVLPEVLRNSVKEVIWSSEITKDGILDKYDVTLDADITRAFDETLNTASAQPNGLEEFVPAQFVSATRYNLKDPRLAWRSILLSLKAKTDAVSGNLISGFSDSLFEPYAIENAEAFLGSAGGELITVKLDPEGEAAAVIARAKDIAELKKSVAKEINFAKPAEKNGDAEVWKSGDGDLAAAFVGNVVILGDAETVLKCLAAKQGGENLSKVDLKQFESTNPAAFTIANEIDPAAAIAEVLGERKDENTALQERSYTSTSFDAKGMHRTTISDFGLVGAIIEGLAKD